MNVNGVELFKKLKESGIETNIKDRSETRVQIWPPSGARIEKGFAPDGSQLQEQWVWLGDTAAALYPDSEFAKWWRGRNG